MKRFLAPALAVALIAIGCSSDDTTSNTTDSGQVGTGGTLGTGGTHDAAVDMAHATGGTSGSDSGVDAATGDAATADGGHDAMSSADAGTNWAMCVQYSFPGVPAEDFCNEYLTVCEGVAGAFTTKAACLTAYEGFTTNQKTCTAGHLCVAKSMTPSVHCLHAAGQAPCNAATTQ